MSDTHEAVDNAAEWPQPLHVVQGPFSEARIDGAAAGMGDHGPAIRDIVAAGLVQPDLVTGMTLFLLARQPRRERPPNTDRPQRATPIAGGVWVREQFTIHRQLARTDQFEITGEATGRYVRKGRRYGTTRSQTRTSSGELAASNLTTGLLEYRAEAGRDDEVQGLPPDDTPAPNVDWGAAANNPHLAAIRSSTVGQRIDGSPLEISAAMMAARATSQPDNPIHSDAEAAKRTGLAKPIAGGNHVLSFALDPLLALWGSESLSHGAKFDVRWRAPVEADVAVLPTATVAEVASDRVVVDLAMTLVDGPAAMVGTLTVPLPS